MKLRDVLLVPTFDVGLAVRRVDVASFLKTVGEAAGVAKHIDDAHRRCRWARDERHIAAARNEHAKLGEFRDIFGDGVGQRDLALFDQLHERDRGDRFGHRGDAEDGIVGDA